MSEGEARRSFGVKETYVTPLNKRIMAVMESLETWETGLQVIDILNKELILLGSLTRDLKEEFKTDIEKIQNILFDEPTKATGVARQLRMEHALQILSREGIMERKYVFDLYFRITSALDKKGWLDKVMRDVPRNF